MSSLTEDLLSAGMGGAALSAAASLFFVDPNSLLGPVIFSICGALFAMVLFLCYDMIRIIRGKGAL